MRQKLRITYAKDEEGARLSQQEVARAWEQALKASGLPLETVGPGRPRFAVAAPLPPGYTSEAEVVEVSLREPVVSGAVSGALSPHLPAGIRILRVETVSAAEPPVQTQIMWSEYEVTLGDAPTRWRLESAVAALLGRRECVIEETKGGKTRAVDVRPGIADMEVAEETEGGTVLRMTLRAGQRGNVWPEQVLRALGLGRHAGVHRTRLLRGGLTPVHLAWRTKGRFEER